MNCTGKILGEEEPEPISATLKFSLTFREWDNRSLLTEGQITKNVYVELMSKGKGGRLWPALFGEERRFIKVTRNGISQGLDVELGKLTSAGLGGRRNEKETTEYSFEYQGQTFIKRGTARRQLYEGKIDQGNRWKWYSWDTTPLKESVSLSKCVFRDDKKTAECDLKLVKNPIFQGN